MHPIIFIVRKELSTFSRDKKLLLSCALIWLGWATSLFFGQGEYRHLYQMEQKATERARQEWLGQGEKNPHAAGHTGTILFKPISALFIFDHGLTDYVGQHVALETHSQHETEGRKINNETSLGRMSVFTPNFFLQQLLPLLLFFLCYNAISGEKEQGTWRMLLSQHVKMQEVFWAKWLAGVAKLLLLTFPMYVLILTTLCCLPGIYGRYLFNFHLLWGAYLFYYLILLFIAVAISAASRTSSQALVLLLGFWIYSSIVLPRLSVSMAEIVYPVPSNFHLKKRFDEGHKNKYVYGYKAMESFQQRYEKVQAELMRKYKVNSPDSLKVNTFGFVIEETEEEGQRVYESTYGLVKDVFNAQDRLQRILSFISPVAALQTISFRLSGTSTEEHQSFVQQAEQYRRSMMKTLNMDVAYHSHTTGYNLAKTKKKGAVYVRGKELWEQIPPFSYTPIPLKQHLLDLKFEFSILLCWGILAYAFFHRTAIQWHSF